MGYRRAVVRSAFMVKYKVWLSHNLGQDPGLFARLRPV
jgi:hypothetical protein